MKEQSLARGLSCFSLGLGSAELLAPRHVAQLIGLNDDHDTLIRVLGLREISSGLGIMQGKPGLFLWSRVVGDAMDLALLGLAMRSPRNDRRRLGTAMAAVAGVTALDVLASVLCSRDTAEPGWRVSESDRYAAGIERGDPQAMRAYCDEAMTGRSERITSTEAERTSGSFAGEGENELDRLAGHDDGLDQTERSDNPLQAGNPS